MQDKQDRLIVLENKNTNEFEITRESNIEETDLCDCYANHGSQIGCHDAGCYSIDNSDSPFKTDLKVELETEFSFLADHDILEFCDTNYKDVIDNTDLSEDQKKQVIQFIKSFIEENTSHTKAKSFTYWDGCNYRSIILKSEGYEDTTYVVADTNTTKKILAAYKRAEFSDFKRGLSQSKNSRKYQFTKSLFSDNPFIATCTLID